MTHLSTHSLTHPFSLVSPPHTTSLLPYRSPVLLYLTSLTPPPLSGYPSSLLLHPSPLLPDLTFFHPHPCSLPPLPPHLISASSPHHLYPSPQVFDLVKGNNISFTFSSFLASINPKEERESLEEPFNLVKNHLKNTGELLVGSLLCYKALQCDTMLSTKI